MLNFPTVGKKPQPLTLEDIGHAWEAENALHVDSKNSGAMPIPAENRGWQVVRLYISSTFNDFESEREILYQKVVPELKQFCENKKLTLIACDLRQGVPLSCEPEIVLQTLEELDRCYEDNSMPFFLNMTGSRVGYFLDKDSEILPEWLKSKYNWHTGFSLTEMEIMHGAYRTCNPNALIMIRNDIQGLPGDKAAFFNENQLSPLIALRKIDILKQNLIEKFEPTCQVGFYTSEYDDQTDLPRLKGLQEFEDRVKDFFMRRISTWYPDVSASKALDDPLERINAQQTSFMLSKADEFDRSGRCRNAKVRDMVTLLCSNSTSLGPKPYVVTGPIGIGKTTLVAKVAKELVDAKRGSVFYHFVGQTVMSNELLVLLQRMLLHLGVIARNAKQNLPQDITTAIKLFNAAIAKKETKSNNYLFILVDGLDQLDEDEELVEWLPREMTANSRWVFSFAESNRFRSFLAEVATFDALTDFSPDEKRPFAEIHLKRYNIEFTPSQMSSFVERSKGTVPLWSYLALEKLSLERNFSDGTKKIVGLDLGMNGLFDKVLATCEDESSQQWLATAVSLLVYSQFGLLESELLTLLETIDSFPLLAQFSLEIAGLLANKPAPTRRPPWSYKMWATIYNLLKPYIRPYNRSSQYEGLLYFHHQQIIDAAKDRYVKRWTHVETFILESLFTFFKQSKRKDRVEAMSKAFLRSGHYEYALELYDTLVALGQNESVEAANLYVANGFYLHASLFDAKLQDETIPKAMNPEQMAEVRRCCELYQMAVDILSTSPFISPLDSRIGRCFERLYFRQHGFLQRRTSQPATKDGQIAVDYYCKKLFDYCEELDEPARQIAMADSWITRGVCEKNLRYLKRGLDIAETGRLRRINIRAMRCIAEHFEEDGNNNEEAYNYYLKWYDLLVETFGPTHPKTKPALDILDKEQFRPFAP